MWANLGPTWGQLDANVDLKIIEKPLFFLGFFIILKKFLEAFGNAFGDPLGTPWGGLGDALGGFGDALGGPWDDRVGLLGGPGAALGALLGKTSLEDLLEGPTRDVRTWEARGPLR